MRVNNFKQRYKTHTEAFKSQIGREEINKEQKEYEKKKKEEDKKQKPNRENNNEVLLQTIILMIEQMSKTMEVFQEILLTICSSINEEDRVSKMKIYIEKLKRIKMKQERYFKNSQFSVRNKSKGNLKQKKE